MAKRCGVGSVVTALLALALTTVMVPAAHSVTAGQAGSAAAGAAIRLPANSPLSQREDSSQDEADGKLHGRISASGSQTVFVRFRGAGAALASSQAQRGVGTRSAAATLGRSAASQARHRIRGTADSVLSTARRADGDSNELFTTTNAVPGVALTLDRAGIAAVAARADVQSVSVIVPKRRSTAGAAQLGRVLQEWQRTGQTGKGVKIGIIDTGIDYTHADFGGKGTVAAYQKARAASSGPWTPTAVVAGGYDFVGDDYDAWSGAAPVPDPNPMDCDGHGTHVAGIAAGRGVQANGATFTGDYRTLTGSSLYGMKIGPGMAPQASLYALRVIGCNGSTDMVIPALDWALDPNGDGDYSDHLDIVNLSLGVDYGATDDPENEFINTLAEHGVLPVIAAGNGGDLTDVVGAPGSATRALTVASSVDQYQLQDGVRVLTPTGVAGTVAGQFAVDYPWAGKPDVEAAVVRLSAGNSAGCAELSSADAKKARGRIVWLSWDDDDATRECGSVQRSLNLTEAGAVGIVVPTTLDPFSAGIAGTDEIPMVQLTKVSSEKLQPALSAGTLKVRLSGTLRGSVTDVDDTLSGTLSGFSSRGIHGGGAVSAKPDVAAPGDTIASAAIGTGSQAAVDSGTSMASPMAAGVAALVLASHRGWTPEQVKAAVMNTADRDLTTGRSGTGATYGPLRVGAGQIDADAATATTSLAYTAGGGGGVTVTFGQQQVPVRDGVRTVTRRVTVQNQGTSSRKYSVRYSTITKQTGVSYKVSPSTLSLKPGASGQLTVRMRIDPSALRRDRDPTMAADQRGVMRWDGTTASAARQYEPVASGRLLVTADQQTLRVPVVGSARPVSTTATSVARRLTAQQATATLNTTGQGVDGGGAESVRYTSRQSVLTLGASSPQLQRCAPNQLTDCLPLDSAAAADIRYVAAGTSPGTDSSPVKLWFAVSMWGQWSTLSEIQSVPMIYIDKDADGLADFELEISPLPETDLYYTKLYDAYTGALLDQQPANFLTGDHDSNVFDTDTILLPVDPTRLGMAEDATSFPISYSVITRTAAAEATGGILDQSVTVGYDVANPALSTPQPLYPDLRGQRIPVTLNPSATAVTALVVHLYGAPGQRSQLVTLRR